jgi:vacuolar-type H+-ATPase subunit I/STV1
MIQKSRLLPILILLFSVTTANAQTPSNNSSLDNFTTTLAKSGLSEVTRTKIKNLIIARDQTLAENKKSQEAQEANNPIAFQDSETTPKFVNQQFCKSLSEIISIDQFKKLFLPQLQPRITRITNDKLLFFKNKYKLTTEQEDKLKRLLSETTVNEVVAKEYYNYDDIISRDNCNEEKIKATNKERELIKSFGFFYSKNKKTDILIKKLIDASVDGGRINKFLIALQTQQEKTAQHDRTWRVNDTTSVFYFHDEGDAIYKIDMDLREEMSKILTMAEFKTIYLSQLQTRINREAQKEFATLKENYKFTEVQYAEIQKLIQEKHTEMIITEEYYKFSYELYQQKLRAAEYRHGKAILEIIQKFESQNETKTK